MRYLPFTRISIILLLLFFFGCAGLEKHIQTPTVQYAGSHIKSASIYDASIDFLIHVDNPNPIALPVQGMSYTVDINGKRILSGSAQPDMQIAAISSTNLTIPVVVRYEEFLDGLQQLMHEDSFDYAIKGEINLGFFKLPYDAGGTIALPKLPKIQLKAINVKKFSFNGIDTAIRFNIENRNDFPLKANGLTYRVLLNKIATLSGESGDSIDVPPNSQSTVEISSTFSLLELGKVLETFKHSNSVNAMLTGQINIPAADGQNKSIPFNWSGETAITH